MYMFIRNMDDGQVFMDGYSEKEYDQCHTDYMYTWGLVQDMKRLDIKSIYLLRVFENGRVHIMEGEVFRL